MIPYSSGTLQQVDAHESVDPGHQKDRIGNGRKRKREENLQMTCDENKGWGQSQ